MFHILALNSGESLEIGPIQEIILQAALLHLDPWVGFLENICSETSITHLYWSELSKIKVISCLNFLALQIMQLQRVCIIYVMSDEGSEMRRVRTSCSSGGFRCHLPIGRAQSGSANQRPANSGSTNERAANSSSLFCPAGHRQPVKGRTLLM